MPTRASATTTITRTGSKMLLRAAVASVGVVGALKLAVVLVALVVIASLVVGSSSSGGAAAAAGTCAPESSGQAGSVQLPMAEGTYTPTSGFGPRWGTNHRGQDYGAALGTPIYAIADGVVEQAGAASGFGNWIVIRHDVNGQVVSTVYGHMYADGLQVQAGESVTAGQQIAVSGNDGISTGPHLHFEVWVGGRFAGGTPVDPVKWIADNAAALGQQSTQASNSANPSESPDSTNAPDDDLLPYTPSAKQIDFTATAEQVENVRAIVGAVNAAGLPLRAAVIAVATAMQESSLRNIAGGDRDSVGLFQQRPSMGWGTPEQLLDPAYSTGKFLEALVRVPNWQTGELTVVAQAVQISGHPTEYAKWEQKAASLVAENADAQGSGAGASPCVNDGSQDQSGPAEVPPDLVTNVNYPVEVASVPDPTGSSGQVTARLSTLYEAMQSAGLVPGAISCWAERSQNSESDHPAGKACDIMFGHPDPAEISAGWNLANWLVTNQSKYGVSMIIWQGQRFAPSSPQWAEYTSTAYGCPDPSNVTGCHYDHVHVSVF